MTLNNKEIQLNLCKILCMLIFKGTVMQIDNTLIHDRLRVSKVPRKFHILSTYNFAVVLHVKFVIFKKVAYFLTVSVVFSVYKQSFTAQ